MCQNEQRLIRKEICLFGAYVRKMLIDGYIINVDDTEQKKLAAAVSLVATNINHIFRRINSTGYFYADDVAELETCQTHQQRGGAKCSAAPSVVQASSLTPTEPKPRLRQGRPPQAEGSLRPKKAVERRQF